ncbi:type IV secretion system DNA-binding domain-containing protein [Vibrio sp. ZF 223]|uniref:type IV secretion system DNA-binding domain-containing protein n=1 Tax=Vibrio sp. ZF 223 TaxID=2056191 RepID=UPI000D3C86DB|nr:type IV secretion system DNA-binding domain-containing protein [Vibrio sp. ZF 223]PTP99713.1 hypothetical protein CWO13_18915 [Vibrio sp. ZF 223]
MNDQHPPSFRSQPWFVIVLASFMVFFLSLVILLYFSWHIGSSWGHFSQHWPHWKQIVAEYLFHNHFQHGHNYWQWIAEHNFEWHFVVHTGLALAVSLLLAFGGGRCFYFPGGRDRLRHISGPQLYWKRNAIKHAQRQLSRERRDHPQLGLKLHPDITISRVRESGNVFIGGAQGTGKTVVITPLIQQVIERGERAFIYDEKREFTALFYDSKSCLLVAPWDERSQAWNISADASNAPQAQLIAERLIPDSSDPLWSNGSRMILAGMIEVLNHTQKQWGWSELADILSLDEVDLHEKLAKHHPRSARFIAENSKTTQSFFAQLLGSLGWIYTLADAWPRAYQDGFSITEWTAQPSMQKSVIIVQADKRFKDVGAPLANALIALMTSNILSQTNTTTRELWLFLDELANLPRNDSLYEWMCLGRSKGCRIVAGTQSISQLKQIYSENGADSLLNMFTMFISMRVGSAGETASYTAKAFGEREVERPTSSAGPQDHPVLNWHRETLPLITVSDLVHLPQASRRGVEGFLLIPGWLGVYRLLWPIASLPIQALEHCPAAWLSKKPPSKATLEVASSRREQLRRRRHHAVDERY